MQHHRSTPTKIPSLSRPRVAFFMTHRRPSHPLLPRVVILCVDALRHHLPAMPPMLVDAAAMPVPSTQRQGPTQRLCFLLPHWHCVWPRLALQLPSLAPRRHGVLPHAHLPHGPIQCHPLSSSPVPTTYEQTPSASPPRKAAATVTSLLRLAVRACTPVALPLRRAITSISPSLRRPALPPRNARL
jgi:hypothetical protein